MPSRTTIEAALAMLDEVGIGRGPLDAKGRTRARLIRAAKELFQQRGYRHTSIDDVARHAGVAKGTVYVHFKNKSELLFHALAEEKKRFVERFLPLFGADLPPTERFRRYLELGLKSLHDSPLLSKLLEGDREVVQFLEELDPALRQKVEDVQLAEMNALLSGIGAWDGLDANEREQRMIVLRSLFFHAGQLMGEPFRRGLSVERVAELLSKIIVHGVAAP